MRRSRVSILLMALVALIGLRSQRAEATSVHDYPPLARAGLNDIIGMIYHNGADASITVGNLFISVGAAAMGFLTGNETLTVCAAGCQYTTIRAA